LPNRGRALAAVERCCFGCYDFVTCWYSNTTLCEPLLTGSAFNFCFYIGSVAVDAFFTCSRHCRAQSQSFIM